MGGTLPENYGQTIERIRESIPRAKLAFRVFQWLLRARTALRTDALCEALAIDERDKRLSKQRMPSIETILDFCQGFVVVRELLKTVDFFHATIREYLKASPEIFKEVPVDVAKSYLTYVSLDDFIHPCSNAADLQRRQTDHPFAASAARYWPDHVRGSSEHVHQTLLVNILTTGNVVSMIQLVPEAYYRLFGCPMRLLEKQTYEARIPIYLSVCFQLKETLKVFLSQEPHNASTTVP